MSDAAKRLAREEAYAALQSAARLEVATATVPPSGDSDALAIHGKALAEVRRLKYRASLFLELAAE